MDEPTDIMLMLSVREGDEAAFEVLHARYQARVLGFFWGLTHDAHAANELAQEAFLRIWQVRLRYKATGPFPAYLFAIARMVLMERRRKVARLSRLGERIAQWGGQAEPIRPPDAYACDAETESALFAALDDLPEEQRMAFLLHEVQGLPMNEVAAALDCPLNTARSRRILAVRKLRQVLSPFFASLTGAAGVE